MKKTKVLQIFTSNNARSSGIFYLGEHILSALPKDRYQTTTLFLCGSRKPDHLQSAADETVYLNLRESQIKGLRLSASWRLFQFLRSRRYDVAICHRYKPVSMLLLLNRWLRLPLCIGVSHGFGEYDRSYRKRQLRRSITPAWRFVGVSPAVKAHLIGLGAGLDEGNTQAITNAVDLGKIESQQLSRLDARKALGLPRDGRTIGALGRLVPLKGHRNLIEAFASLTSRFPDVQLAIIGDGREMDKLKQLAVQLGVADRVYLPGFRENAASYVTAFDVFAMPSTREGLGLALLEGMAGKLPVVASEVPAMLPLIEGAHGIAVPPGDVDALATALEKYLKLDRQALQDAGERSYQYVLENHGLDEFRAKYLSLIEGCLGGQN